jgi:DnaJ-class molecular chaperone
MAESNPCLECDGTGVGDWETPREGIEVRYPCAYCGGSGLIWSRDRSTNGHKGDRVTRTGRKVTK